MRIYQSDNPSCTEGSGGGSGITTDQFTSLMVAIEASKSSVKAQMQGLKRELQESQEKVLENVVKVRRSKQPEFKRKGNEIQYCFNEQVAEKRLPMRS